jgi:hypothetical protein
VEINARCAIGPLILKFVTELIPAMKAARARGDITYIHNDRLIVHPPSKKPGRDERAKPVGSQLQPRSTHTN